MTAPAETPRRARPKKAVRTARSRVRSVGVPGTGLYVRAAGARPAVRGRYFRPIAAQAVAYFGVQMSLTE